MKTVSTEGVVQVDMKDESNDVFNKNKVNHYVFSSLLTTLAGLITFPVLTRLLSKADYGIYSLIQALQLFYEAILKSGFQFSIVRMYHQHPDKKWIFIKSLLMFPLVIAFWITIVGTVSLFLLSDKYSVNPLYSLVLISGMAGITISLFRSYMHARGRSFADSMLDILNKYLYLILVIPFVSYISMSYWGVIEAICISSVCVAMTTMWVNRDVFQARSAVIDYQLIWQSLKYSTPLFLTEMTILTIAYVDRFVMAALDVDFSDIGIYAIGFGLANVIYLLLWKLIQPSILPNANVIHDKYGIDKVTEYLSKHVNLMMLAFTCLSVGVFLNAESFMVILSGEDKRQAYVIFQFAIVLFLLKVLSMVLFYGFHLYHKTKPVFISELVVALSNIALNIILIPVWGMYGALVATFIAFMAGLIMKFVFIDRRYLPVKVFSGLGVLIGILFVYSLIHITVIDQHVENVFMKLSLSVFLFLALMLPIKRFWLNKFRESFRYEVSV